jgi:hypothetical protein
MTLKKRTADQEKTDKRKTGSRPPKTGRQTNETKMTKKQKQKYDRTGI